MAVISTFDQWQKDVFFSVAEEVQESADTMESVYRMWVRERIDGFEPEFLTIMQRELHTTLGTAKWQLEEFEKAVSLSHQNYPDNDTAITRHREFIDAIRDKISHVERAIITSRDKEGKQPFRWVQLDEGERDDFETFLSMPPENLQGKKEKLSDCETVRGFKETVTISGDASYLVEVAAKEPNGAQDVEDFVLEDNFHGHERGENSPDIEAWTITIADEEGVDKKLVESASSFRDSLRSVESTARLKWGKNLFGKAKRDEYTRSSHGLSNYLDLKGISLLSQGIKGLSERSRSCFSSYKENPKSSSIQQIGRINRWQQQFQGMQSNKRSIWLTLLLVLTIFLIVPFVSYST